MNLLHDRAGALSSNRKSHIRGLVFDLALDSVELTDERKYLLTGLREALFDLHKLSSGMRPAVRELHVAKSLLQRVIHAIAVAHHGAREVFEKLRGRIVTNVN
jgi:hypothetical protein